MERDITNLKMDYQTTDTSLQYGEKWYTLVHYEIRDCGWFAPTLRFVFQSFHKATR